MGDWFLGADGQWAYDAKAPSLGQNPALTHILNAVTPSLGEIDPNQMPPEEQHHHGGDE